MAPGAAGDGLASFQGWQTAALNLLPRPQGLVGAAGKGLPWPEWRLGAGDGLASFQGWQTAALNLHKGHCHGLRNLLELQERSAVA